jgi:ubiquinone/menaquinone biosynthesis C-methylase UbiE
MARQAPAATHARPTVAREQTRACGMKPLMADSQSAYDAVADAYRRILDPEGRGLSDPVLTDLLGELGDQVVLSLACGQGQDARLLASLGAKVTGIDVSTEMLRYATEHEAINRRGITYIQGNAQDLEQFVDASFDGVLCHMALMDIPDLPSTIQAVARVLRDGGWFVFSIVHPAYYPHVQIISDYLLDHRYPKQRPVDWLPAHAYHRPIALYVNELAGVGLRIERLVETHQAGERDPVGDRAERDAGKVPGLLYARAAKR